MQYFYLIGEQIRLKVFVVWKAILEWKLVF